MRHSIKYLFLSSVLFLSACVTDEVMVKPCDDITDVEQKSTCLSKHIGSTVYNGITVAHLIKQATILTEEKIKIDSVSNLGDISFSKDKNVYFVQVFVNSAPNGYYPIYFLTENDAKRFKDYFDKAKYTTYSTS